MNRKQRKELNKKHLLEEKEETLNRLWKKVDELSVKQRKMVLTLVENENEPVSFIDNCGNLNELLDSNELIIWEDDHVEGMYLCQLGRQFRYMLQYSLENYNKISHDDINKIRKVKLYNYDQTEENENG